MKRPEEEQEYTRFAGPQRRDKLLSTFIGMLEGINSDGEITPAEVKEFREWFRFNSQVMSRSPFSSLSDAIKRALEDGVLRDEERQDLIWLARNVRSDSPYFDHISHDLQELGGILHGILADGVVAQTEIHSLSDWLDENRHLCGMYPFDEIDSVVTNVLRDGKITNEEQSALRVFFQQFCNLSPASMPKEIPGEIKSASKQLAIDSIFAIDPPISFDGRSFCFTGQSIKCPRKELWDHVENRGGQPTNSIVHSLDFLVICHQGSVCWTYCTFGRKIELVLNERKSSGRKTLIVCEADFWDAIADNPLH